MEMHPEKNGFIVCECSVKPIGPYKVYDTDKWKCPMCGKEVVVGFGENAIAVHHEPHFKKVLESVDLYYGYNDESWKIAEAANLTLDLKGVVKGMEGTDE